MRTTQRAQIEPDSLREAMEKFAEWRKIRRRGQRIPKQLWKLAVELARHHPPAEVAKVLRLNYTKLQSYITRPKEASTEVKVLKVAPVQFVDSPILPSMGQRSARSSMIAEVTTSSGISVRMFSGIDPESLKALTGWLQEVQ